MLLFCQMTRMLDVLEDWLRFSGVGLSPVEAPAAAVAAVAAVAASSWSSTTAASTAKRRLRGASD